MSRFQHLSRMVFYRLWQLEGTNPCLKVTLNILSQGWYPRYKVTVASKAPLRRCIGSSETVMLQVFWTGRINDWEWMGWALAFCIIPHHLNRYIYLIIDSYNILWHTRVGHSFVHEFVCLHYSLFISLEENVELEKARQEWEALENVQPGQMFHLHHIYIIYNFHFCFFPPKLSTFFPHQLSLRTWTQP